MKDHVLQAMRDAGKPLSAGDVAKALGADRKEVDKAFADFRDDVGRPYLPVSLSVLQLSRHILRRVYEEWVPSGRQLYPIFGHQAQGMGADVHFRHQLRVICFKTRRPSHGR